MNNLLSYFWLVDTRVSISEKDLPVSSSLEILLAAGALLQPPTLGVKVEVVTIHHEKTSAKK